MSRLEVSIRVPGAVLMVTLATLSGRPSVRFAKWLYLNVSRLRELMTHDPSAMAIFCVAAPPVPVVAAAFEAKRSLLSVRSEPR